MENSNNRVMRLPEVIKKVGLGRSTIYAWMHQGFFPLQIHLGPRTVGWLESDVDKWLSEKTGKIR